MVKLIVVFCMHIIYDNGNSKKKKLFKRKKNIKLKCERKRIRLYYLVSKTNSLFDQAF